MIKQFTSNTSYLLCVSLTRSKHDMFDVNCFNILVLNFNTLGCLQSKNQRVRYRHLTKGLDFSTTWHYISFV